MSEMVCVGAIAGAYGVKGEVRLKSFCAEPEAIGAYGALLVEDGSKSFEVTLTGQVKNGFSARLSGIATKEQADILRGTRLYVPRDRFPEAEDDEYYHADLIGLGVFDTGGSEIGRVKAVLNHGAGDLLEVHGPELKGTVLLPFTRTVIPTVDISGGRIVADPPDGLI